MGKSMLPNMSILNWPSQDVGRSNIDRLVDLPASTVFLSPTSDFLHIYGLYG